MSLKDIPVGEQLLKIVVSYNVDTGMSIYRGHGKPKQILSCQWVPANCRLTGKVTVFSGKQPLIPQERFTLDEIIERYCK